MTSKRAKNKQTTTAKSVCFAPLFSTAGCCCCCCCCCWLLSGAWSLHQTCYSVTHFRPPRFSFRMVTSDGQQRSADNARRCVGMLVTVSVARNSARSKKNNPNIQTKKSIQYITVQPKNPEITNNIQQLKKNSIQISWFSCFHIVIWWLVFMGTSFFGTEACAPSISQWCQQFPLPKICSKQQYTIPSKFEHTCFDYEKLGSSNFEVIWNHRSPDRITFSKKNTTLLSAGKFLHQPGMYVCKTMETQAKPTKLESQLPDEKPSKS